MSVVYIPQRFDSVNQAYPEPVADNPTYPGSEQDTFKYMFKNHTFHLYSMSVCKVEKIIPHLTLYLLMDTFSVHKHHVHSTWNGVTRSITQTLPCPCFDKVA